MRLPVSRIRKNSNCISTSDIVQETVKKNHGGPGDPACFLFPFFIAGRFSKIHTPGVDRLAALRRLLCFHQEPGISYNPR